MLHVFSSRTEADRFRRERPTASSWAPRYRGWTNVRTELRTLAKLSGEINLSGEIDRKVARAIAAELYTIGVRLVTINGKRLDRMVQPRLPLVG